MSIDLKKIGAELFGGSVAGDLVFGGGGAVDSSRLGYASGGGGQPPLLDKPMPEPAAKGGFLSGLKDFFDSLTDKPSTNAGAAAGAALYEKAKPWLIGAAVIGGGLLLWKVRK